MLLMGTREEAEARKRLSLKDAHGQTRSPATLTVKRAHIHGKQMGIKSCCAASYIHRRGLTDDARHVQGLGRSAPNTPSSHPTAAIVVRLNTPSRVVATERRREEFPDSMSDGLNRMRRLNPAAHALQPGVAQGRYHSQRRDVQRAALSQQHHSCEGHTVPSRNATVVECNLQLHANELR
jgi:hypothetical protein